MQAPRVAGLAMLALGLSMALACGRQSPVPVAASETMQAPDDARLPFDREAQADGISPTSSVIPPSAQVPAGTPIVIRVGTKLSSARARSNDKFKAELDEPIVVNEQVVAERGTEVTGRVVDARSMAQLHSPGYLRLTLSSIRIEGTPAFVRTSTAFLKGDGSGRRNMVVPVGGEGALLGAVASNKAPLIGSAMVADGAPVPSLVTRPREAMVGPDRRLTFRLIEPLPLHP